MSTFCSFLASSGFIKLRNVIKHLVSSLRFDLQQGIQVA